jgi:hypothetical protein
MWKATITDVKKDEVASVADVTITYSNDDGRSEVVTERISDPNSLSQVVSNGLNELNRVDAIATLVATPPIGEVVLPQPVVPTQAASDWQSYNTQKQTLITMKQNLDLGLVTQLVYDQTLESLQAFITEKNITQI